MYQRETQIATPFVPDWLLAQRKSIAQQQHQQQQN